MDGKELRHELMRTMHRFRRLNMANMFGPLTRGEFFALEILESQGRQNAHRGVYVSELADKLDVSPPAVSRMLRHMEENHWVERRVEQSDRRNTLVMATQAGVDARVETGDQLKRYSDDVIAAMGTEDMTTLLLLWNQLIGTMELELGQEKQKKETRT